MEIPITPDSLPELDEQFSLQLIIRRPALFAPSTSLRNDQITFTIINDDPEIPSDAVTFHNFDQQVIQPGIPPVIGWGFAAEPQFAADFVTVSPLSHSSDSTIDSPSVPKLEPGALHGLPTRGVGSDQWEPSGNLLTGNLIENPGAEEGLGSWLRLAGTWGNRPLSGPDPEIGTNYFRAAVPGGRTSQLSQTVSLREFENTIRSGSQQLVLSALLRTSRATASGHVELEFRDSLGRVVGSAQTQSASSISQWQKQLLTIEVPKSATEVQVILSGAAAGTGADVYFDEISLQPIFAAVLRIRN